MKKINNYLKNKCIVFFMLFVVSLIILLVCSKNSPLYSFNDWVDAHAFFTMGKGIFNGKIPYKDLFEQKGPLLYLIYGIGYLISHDTFIGIFILKCVSYTIFSYFLYLISKNYLENINSLLITVLVLSLIAGSVAFVQGGSAEEFCLPFFSASMYYFIKMVNTSRFNKNEIFINGILAGCISLIKFNLLGFWFIWMAMYFFRLLFLKRIKEALVSCIIFLLGMGLPIIISIVYFSFNNALNDYIDTYITFNLTAYSTQISFKNRIMNMFSSLFQQLSVNKLIKVLIVVGFFSLFTNRIISQIWVRLFVILSFLFLMMGIYMGGLPFIYYFLCFEFYTLFGLIAIAYILEKYSSIKIIRTIFIAVVLTVSSYYVYQSPNKSEMKVSKEHYAQYVFKNIIEQSENTTLLNYDNLDGGFYTTCNIVPNIKYFMRQNVDYNRYPQIIDGQNEAIENKKVEFVVIREYFANKGYRKTLNSLNKNYYLVKEFKQKYEGMDFTYYLYQLR